MTKDNCLELALIYIFKHIPATVYITGYSRVKPQVRVNARPLT